MSDLSLYVIAQEHRAMVDKLMELTDDPQTIADTIEGESFPLETKATNVAFAYKSLVMLAEAGKKAEAQMKARRERIEKQAERVLAYLQYCMEVSGKTKIESPWFTLAIKNNPPSVDVFEPALVPRLYLNFPEPPAPTMNKAAIAKAIKDGWEVPGARLVTGRRLDIS